MDNWNDTSKNHLNQADEQMRLFTRCIEYLLRSVIPLPRLWYFPNRLRSLVVLTNDGEFSTEEQFEAQFRDVEEYDACMTLYILKTDLVKPEVVADWIRRGHEISGHPDDTTEASDPTCANMDAALACKGAEIRDKYGLAMLTCANHWFVWCGRNDAGDPDFTAQARLYEKHGIGMDMNYVHYVNGSPLGQFLGQPGNYTGSGLPMKFADGDGNVINVYQMLTNVYDQQYMENDDPEGFFNCFRQIMDRSLEAGAYSFIGLKAHNDEWHWSRTPVLRMLEYAKRRGIPVWTALNALEFLQDRAATRFENITWDDGRLTFDWRVASNRNSLTCLVPLHFGNSILDCIMLDGQVHTHTSDTVKGREYAFITVTGIGSYKVDIRYQQG